MATTSMDVEEISTTAEEINYNTILKDLEIAEDHIQRIIEIASETCGQLTEAPFCDYAELKKLSKEYSTSLELTNKLIKEHIDILELEPELPPDYDFSEEIAILKEKFAQLQASEEAQHPEFIYRDAPNEEEEDEEAIF